MDEAFECLLNELYEHAYKTFYKTDIGQMLDKQLEQMNNDIETNLSAREKEFTYACLETLLNACGKESVFAYRPGLRDGVAILKRLGVIAS